VPSSDVITIIPCDEYGVDMGAGELARPLTESQHKRWSALCMVIARRPGEMTDDLLAEFAELSEQHERFMRNPAARAAHARRWSKGLTPERVRDLDQKIAADPSHGYGLTYEEMQQYLAAMWMSRPSPKAGDEAWARWYFGSVEANSSGSGCPAQFGVVRRQSRGRAASRARRVVRSAHGPPGREPSGDDDPPHGHVVR